MNLRKFFRDSFLRNFGCPVIDAACNWKTLFHAPPCRTVGIYSAVRRGPPHNRFENPVFQFRSSFLAIITTGFETLS